MVPTVGRIVHLYPGPNRHDLHANGLKAQDPIAAVITRVWGDGEAPTINVLALLDATTPTWVTSVQHATVAPTDGMRWDWPPRT